MTDYACPKCGKTYEWGFKKLSWADMECLLAYCDCGFDGEQCGIVEGKELVDHKRYIANGLWWKRASDEQKDKRTKEWIK